jgi:hypothetical protein
VLILLAESRQLIFDDRFNLFFRILLLVLFDFNGLALASTSSWVVDCSTRSSGLLVSVVARQGSMDGCGWVIWGYMCGFGGCLSYGEDLTSNRLR